MEFQSTYSNYNQSNPAFTSPMENTEDIDTSSRPRLTQEQITILEQEFGKLPKPSTDFKKQLADRIGLTLPRVNNWYQNRRAKTKNGAKHTEAQFEVRTDDLQLIWPTFDHPFHGVPTYIGAADSPLQAQNIVSPSPAAEHIHNSSGYFGAGNFDFQLDSLQTEEEVVPASGSDIVPMTFNDLDFDTDLCPPGIAIPASECKMPTVEAFELGLGSYSPDTPMGFAIPQDIPADPIPQSLYHVVDNGLLVGNLSDQTFTSAASSSDGEQPSMMTPPEGPSPIAFRPQEEFDRRPSITGGLTADFQNGFHLQRQTSGQSAYEDANKTSDTRVLTPAMLSPLSTPAQWSEGHLPPSLNLDTFTECTSAVAGTDLAARRKRPRPAPLIRPEAHRSHSYNGPLTSSPPSARKSLLNPSQPVRRIRSNLDVFSGRIQKPRSTSAQHSPRNLESRFQNAFPSEQSSRCVSTTFQSPPTPLSAVHAADSSIDYSSHFSDYSNQVIGTPTTVEGSFNLNSPPTTPYDVSPFSTGRPRGLFFGQTVETHQPPQSAPPQKTTFFMGDSPPMPKSSINHLSWQPPLEVPLNHSNHVPVQSQFQLPSNHYEHAQSSVVAQQQTYPSPPQHQVPSQMQYSFGPPQLQPSAEHLYQNAQQFGFPPYQPQVTFYQHGMHEMQAQQQQLEIKVELGPQPKGPPQPRKQYTFSNSTPDDYSSKEE